MKRALSSPPPLEKRPAMELKGKKGMLHVYRVRTG
jgi:hypothetical protein